MSDLFYLQDSRSNVGTGAMWWALAGGYTSNLDKAEAFTRERALKLYENRDTDLPWPKAYIDERHHIGVDCQYVKSDEAIMACEGEVSFYAAYHRAWNGNDLIWLSSGGAATSNLADAIKFIAADTPALSAKGFQVFPAAYIDDKARRLISVERMNHKIALRGTGIKRIKPKKPRMEMFNCSGCGRFISDRQRFFENCRNCGAENTP